MKLGSNTVLITGGVTGIGFAIVERFLEAGSRVIICGRREDSLLKAKEKHPEINVRACDVERESQRISHTFGVPLDEFAEAVMKRIENGETEIPYGTAKESSNESQTELDEIFKGMNQPME